MDLEYALPLEVDPERLYREIVYGRGGPLSEWINSTFVVLARPGEAPAAPPKAGDILVRVALGEPGLGHAAMLSSTLTRRGAVGAADPRAQSEGSGLLGTVIESSAFPNIVPVSSVRRVLGPDGRMPYGQLLLRRKRLGRSEL